MTVKLKLNEVTVRAWLICALTLSLPLAACETSFDDGGHPYLTLGSDKRAAVAQMQTSGQVTNMRPEVTEVIRAVAEGPELDRVLMEDGFVVSGPNLYFKVEFESDLVKSLYTAPANPSGQPKFNIGSSRILVIETVRRLFRDGVANEILNFVPDSRWVTIDKMSADDWVYLESYDTWTFNENGQYSVTKIEFEQGKLVSIVKNWTPVELP
jgi:hypothetical protein